jgi:DNA-binding NtrC family response regulator
MFRPDEDDLKLAAHYDVTVLVTAERATDRLVVARFIHRRSDRARGPFLVLDHGSGRAATDALRRAFEHARGGTLFIDDVAQLDAEAQAALLSLVENEQVVPDVRVITGANRSLYEAIAGGAFSARLYYRLNLIHVNGDNKIA